jgi:hypothetical protein
MARALLTSQRKGTGGGIVSFAAPVLIDGIAYQLNRGSRFLVQVGATPTTLTFVTPGVADAGALPDKSVGPLTANSLYEFDGFFERAAEYMQPDGTIWVNFSSVTAIGVAVLI